MDKQDPGIKRVFNGSLSLLGILMAGFSYSVIQYNIEKPSDYASTFLILSIVTGSMVSACGISALWAHLLMPCERAPCLYWFFFAILVCATLTPVLIWKFNY